MIQPRPIFFALAVAFAAAGPPVRAAVEPQLLKRWNSILGQLSAGAARSEVMAEMENLLHDFPEGNHVPEVQNTLAALRLAADREATWTALPDDPNPSQLADRLIDCRLDERYFQYGAAVSAFEAFSALADSEGLDPAMRLYKRGEDAIGALVEAIDDTAATRGLGIYRGPNDLPCVLSKGDVALMLIQEISLCRFFVQGNIRYVHDLPEADRESLSNAVREWWTATSGLTFEERTAWWVRRRPRREQLEITQQLARRGFADLAVSLLREVYWATPAPDATVAERLLDLRDPMPLLDLRRRLAEGERLDADLIAVFVHGGEWDEYRSLVDACRAWAGSEDPSDRDLAKSVFAAVKDEPNAMVVPILVLMLDCDDVEQTAAVQQMKIIQLQQRVQRLADAPGSGTYAQLALRRLQEITGQGFGYAPSLDEQGAHACIERAKRWWETKGKYEYGIRFQQRRIRGGGIK